MKRKIVLKPIRVSRSIDLSAANEVSESMKRSENSKSYLQAIINSLEDELMVIDENYRIIKANDAILVRHGKRQQGVIGQHCYHISHDLHEPCRPPSHECPVKAVWETRKPVRVIRPLTDE